MSQRMHTVLFVLLVILTLPVTFPALLIGASAYFAALAGRLGWAVADGVTEELIE